MDEINYTQFSDEDLLKSVSAGDRSAEEALLSRYLHKVKLISRRFFLYDGDNDDLIQEGMIGLLSAIRKFDSSQDISFNSFASKCIRNRIIDAVKSSHNIEFRSTEELSEDELSLVSDPEEIFIENENYIQKLDKYKQNLSKLEYKVLVMYLDGYSYYDISRILNKPQLSVYNAMGRIRHKLIT